MIMDRYFEDMLPAEEQAQLGFIPTIPEFVSWIEQKWHDLPALSDTEHVRTYAQMCSNIAHKRHCLPRSGCSGPTRWPFSTMPPLRRWRCFWR